MNTSLMAPQEFERATGDDDAVLITSAAPSVEGGSSWFDSARANGWESFESLPMPTRSDEKWRFASVKSLDLSGYRKARPVSSETREQVIERSRGLGKTRGGWYSPTTSC